MNKLIGTGLILLGSFIFANQSASGQQSKNFAHFLIGSNYYDGFGANMGFEFDRILAKKHAVSAGLVFTVKVLDSYGSPKLYALGDSIHKELVMLLSLPILYQYDLSEATIFPYTIVGVVPSIGGIPTGYGGEDYSQFFRGFELDAIIGAGLSFRGLEFEARLGIPLVDPFVRPLNPDNFRAHSILSMLVGIPLYDYQDRM